MLLLTLRGTPTLYYGDEIGMADVPDPAGARPGPVGARTSPGSASAAIPSARRCSGTPRPTPASPPAQPWLPLAADFAAVNVEAEARRSRLDAEPLPALIELRRREPALARGDYAPLAAEGAVLAYSRRHGERRFLIALNLGSAPDRLQLPDEPGGYEPVLSTVLDGGRSPEDGTLELRGDEGVILRAT